MRRVHEQCRIVCCALGKKNDLLSGFLASVMFPRTVHVRMLRREIVQSSANQQWHSTLIISSIK